MTLKSANAPFLFAELPNAPLGEDITTELQSIRIYDKKKKHKAAIVSNIYIPPIKNSAEDLRIQRFDPDVDLAAATGGSLAFLIVGTGTYTAKNASSVFM